MIFLYRTYLKQCSQILNIYRKLNPLRNHWYDTIKKRSIKIFFINKIYFITSQSDSVNGKMLFGEINLKIIFQNKQSMFKKSFAKKSVKDNSLECSFIINTPERNQNVNDMNMASCSRFSILM